MIVLLIVGLTLAALVLKYSRVVNMDGVESTTIFLYGGLAVGAALLWRMQRDKSTTYDALDMLMDNGRASLEAHITIIMAGLAIWWIVTQTNAGKDVSERMIDVLMIFVIYRGAKKAIDAYSKRPVDDPGTQEIRQQVVVTPDAPPAREVRQVRGAKMAAKTVTPMKTATGKSLPKEA